MKFEVGQLVEVRQGERVSVGRVVFMPGRATEGGYFVDGLNGQTRVADLKGNLTGYGNAATILEDADRLPVKVQGVVYRGGDKMLVLSRDPGEDYSYSVVWLLIDLSGGQFGEWLSDKDASEAARKYDMKMVYNPEEEACTHVVKLYRTGYSTVKHFGFREDCEEVAKNLNDQYQTDEYVVEDYVA